MIRKVKAEPMSGRSSAQGSVDDDDPSTLRRKKLSKPSSQLKGEVCGENCLVCNDRVFTRPLAENLTEPESKLSYELREMFYEVYQIPCDDDFLKAKAIKNEFPLCYSCSFRLGQLKGLWERLKELHRDFIKFQETVAFSMVDIVAGAVPTRPLMDFENLKPEELTELLRKKERDTLQDYIYNEWHDKLPSFPDYETNSVPKINPIVDAPPNVKGAVPGIVFAAPTVKPTIFTRPVLTKANIQKTSNGNGLNGKKVNMKLVTPPASLGNGYDQEEIDEAHSDEVDDYTQYNQDYDIGDAPEEEPEHYEQGLEAFQHFASQGHFLDSTNGDWNGGEENEYTDYEQSLEDAEETGMNSRRSSLADMGDGLNSSNIEYQVNEEGLFVCMFCNKTFIHKYPYRDHLKTHTGEGPRCRLCGKIFPKNHNLMLHMRTHTGEKPFTCDICNKGFADKSNLKVHMRVHTGERPYKCDLCNLSFVNSSRLIVHRRMHTGEKPFNCDTCQKCFSTSNQLASHKKSHMSMECSRPFSCMACGKGFSSEENLQNHILSCHPEIMEEN